MQRFHNHRSKRPNARAMTITLRRAALLASVGPLLGWAGLASGQTTRTWVPPTTPDSSNQFWDIGARWSPFGVPLISDSVVFSSTGPYEIHLDAAIPTPSIVNFTNSSGSPIFRRVGTTGSDATLTIQGTAT
jgi:hypothetical protein